MSILRTIGWFLMGVAITLAIVIAALLVLIWIAG